MLLPDDVGVTVAYVAPVNVTQEDPRINRFIETVGDEATRKKVKDYQLRCSNVKMKYCL